MLKSAFPYALGEDARKKSLLMSILLTITRTLSLWDRRKPQWETRNYWNFNNFHYRYSYSESIENQWPFISLEVSVLAFLSSFTKYELHSFRQTWNYSHSSYRVSGILWLLPPVSCHLKQQSKSVWDSKKKLDSLLFTEATVTFLNSTHRMFFNIFNSDWKPNAIIKLQAKCYVENQKELLSYVYL